MDTRNKYCGNCKHFKDEDIEGWGTCKFSRLTKFDDKCIYHSFINNGWTEITPDNERELADELMTRTIIGHIGCDGRMYTTTLHNCHLGIATMAKYGGYYYYVLPELKIE